MKRMLVHPVSFRLEDITSCDHSQPLVDALPGLGGRFGSFSALSEPVSWTDFSSSRMLG